MFVQEPAPLSLCLPALPEGTFQGLPSERHLLQEYFPATLSHLCPLHVDREVGRTCDPGSALWHLDGKSEAWRVEKGAWEAGLGPQRRPGHPAISGWGVSGVLTGAFLGLGGSYMGVSLCENNTCYALYYICSVRSIPWGEQDQTHPPDALAQPAPPPHSAAPPGLCAGAGGWAIPRRAYGLLGRAKVTRGPGGWRGGRALGGEGP